MNRRATRSMITLNVGEETNLIRLLCTATQILKKSNITPAPLEASGRVMSILGLPLNTLSYLVICVVMLKGDVMRFFHSRIKLRGWQMNCTLERFGIEPQISTLYFSVSLTWSEVVVWVSTLLVSFFSGSDQVEFPPGRKLLSAADTLKEEAALSTVLLRVFNL